MKKTISKLWDAIYRRLPEVLLACFLLSLTPLAYLLGRSLYRQLLILAESPGEWLRGIRAAPWTSAGVLVCVLGAGFVIYMTLRNWRSVWAVARKMVMEALHRKVVIVLLLFFLVLVPSLPFILKTEGSLKSQVQLVLLYSLCLGLVLLSLVAIFLTTASICTEVEERNVHVTDTKPLRRWQFLYGKWLGVVVLCTATLVVMTAATYGLVQFLLRAPDYSKMSPEERARALKERRELTEEVFVARRSVQPPMPKWTEEMEERTRKWLAEQKIDAAVHSFRRSLLEEKWRRQQTAIPQEGKRQIVWRFSGLDPDQDGPVQVRFKAFAGGTPTIVGRFMPCNARREKPEGDEGGKGRIVVRQVGVPAYSPPGGWSSNDFHEFSLPGEIVDEDGTLYLVFESLAPTGSVTFDIKDPIEVLQREEGFQLNYYRSLLVLMMHVALLAALGLMAGSLFSFPVASLVVFSLFVGGLLASWFHAQFVEPNIYTRLNPVTMHLERLWRLFAGSVVAVMPDFGRFNPLGDLVNGRIVGMDRVSRAGAVLLFLRGGVAMLIGMYFYARRELARIIV